MADRQTADGIQATVASVRAAITRFANSRGLKEQNTKASLIVPILQAQGWISSGHRVGARAGSVRRRERLCGMLNFYCRKAG